MPLRLSGSPMAVSLISPLKWLSPVPARNQDTPWDLRQRPTAALDYYFIYGNNMDQVIAGYRPASLQKPPSRPNGRWVSGRAGSAIKHKGRDPEHRRGNSRKRRDSIIAGTGATGNGMHARTIITGSPKQRSVCCTKSLMGLCTVRSFMKASPPTSNSTTVAGFYTRNIADRHATG